MVRSDRSRSRLLALLLATALQTTVLVSFATADVAPTPSTADPATTTGSPASPAPSANSPTNAPLAGGSGVTVANDNSLIVQYRNAPSVSTQSTMPTSLSVESSQSINIASSTGTFNAQILDFATPQTMATAETTLQSNSNVIAVTPNLMVTPQVVPNDPSYGAQWAPAAMNLPAAWDTTTGDSNTIVAVLDTGVLLTHPDLANNLWTNPVDGSHGYNFVDGNTNPVDVATIGGTLIGDSGHGTHVAGIIGAEGNNAVGVAGVNWHTSIMSLRVCGPRYGNTTAGCYLDWVLQALQYAYDHGARVANESFGGAGAFSTAERDMITAIAGPGSGLQKGVLVVAAAGNNGQDTTTTPFYPADYGLSNLISVGALSSGSSLASFSNYGWNSVDVLAPGQNIYSTMAPDTQLGQSAGGGYYGYLSGTSMAAPEVSGLAALILSQHPTWTSAQVKRDIIATSTWTPALAPYAFSGGIVNAAAALAGTGTSDTLRMHFSGTSFGSISISGNATCTNDCNVSIAPNQQIVATGTPNANTTMSWSGTCAAIPATSPCSFVAPSLRPSISAIFNSTATSPILQAPLYTTADSLATPVGDATSNGSNFVSTVLTPSGNFRLKISHYWPPPNTSQCQMASSATGGVTVEENISGSWQEEAKFTTPAIGDVSPLFGVKWPQISNCDNFGFGASISDDGSTVVIPLRPEGENLGTASEFDRCGVMVYKKTSTTTWNSGSLVVPNSFTYCASLINGYYRYNTSNSVISGDGSTALITYPLSPNIETVDLTSPTPAISAPILLPNSCRNSDEFTWNGKTNTISRTGTLILLGVNGCSDNASALLLSISGASVSLVKSFTDIPFAGGVNQLTSVALSADNQTVALSFNPSPARVVVYSNHSGSWTLERTLSTLDGLTNGLLCNGLSPTGDRLICGDSTYGTGYSPNLGMVETIDRISSSWSLGQPIPTLATSNIGSPGDSLQVTGSNGVGTTVDGTVGVLRLGDGTYAANYLGQTFSIAAQAFNDSTLPSISGNPAIGTQLTVSAGTWTGFNAGSTALQWYSCLTAADSTVSSCAQIVGSVTSNYTPGAGDVGKFLRVLVTKTQGAVTRQVFSTATAQVQTTGLPAPTISAVTPNSGSTAGGTVITITGTNFVSGAILTLGGTTLTANFSNSTTLTATTPAGSAGAKDVVVINPDHQSATGTGLFTYTVPLAPAPTITSVAPTSGSTAGGTPITINGTGFVTVGTTTVTIGGATVTGYPFSSTIMFATTPAGTAGAKDVTITNPDHQSGTSTGAFTYVAPLPAPTITSVSPTSGTTAGGTAIVITGMGFNPGSTVTIGGVSAVVGTITTTTISATTPAGTLGAKDIVVTNTDGQGVTAAGIYTYTAPLAPAPTITSVSPNSGSTVGGTPITINGTNFVTTGTTTVTIGGATVTGYPFNSTIMFATTPAGTSGVKDVIVTNPDHQTATGVGLFTYIAPAPTIDSISPNSGSTAGATASVITGTGFATGATVTIGGVAATVGAITATTIAVTTPAGSAGAKDVVVTNSDHQSATGTGLFTYVAPVAPPAPAPTITSVSPTSGTTAGGTAIVITGTGFASGATVTIGAVSAIVGTVTSTTITVTTPTGTAGAKDIVVTNTDSQTATGRGLFTYVAPVAPPAPAPTVTSVSPTTGSTDGGTVILITGTGFATGATVTIGGASATVGAITSTAIAATTPAGTAGAKDVVVTNIDNQSATGSGLFTYLAPLPPTPPIVPAPAPTITSVLPNTGSTAGGTAATISGTGFVAGATVTIGGASATVGTITATTIAISTPAGTVGAKDVVVTNLDAQSATGTGLFTYVTPAPPPAPVPTISSVSPTSGSTAGGTALTINGTGFLTGATVTIGGVSATLSSLTATAIIATTPAESAGAKDVVVTNTDHQSVIGTGLFTYVAPVTPPAPEPIIQPVTPPIIRITPIIDWATPASITADTLLSVAQLNATLDSSTNVAGIFTYNPVLGSSLSVGTQTLTATFTPTDLVHYQIATKSVSIVVTPATIVVNPTLSGLSQNYDGSAKSVTVDGIPDGVSFTVTYNGSTQQPVSSGVYAIDVTVTSDGYFGSATGTMTINRAAPNLTWNNPLPIFSDQILGFTQLNATSDVPGKFTYSPDSGVLLPVGEQILTATFTPDDLTDYSVLQISVGLTVKKLPPVIVPAGVVAPVLVAGSGNSRVLTVLTQAQIKAAITAATKKTPVIQIFSYVKPTGKALVDQQLSATRANAVKAQLLKASPKANVVTRPMGGTIEPSCAKQQNTCIIIKVSS